MDLKDIVRAIKRLSPLSPSATRLLALLQSPDSDFEQVARIVEYDGALTANVLKVVNAPAFGLGHHVTSVSRAVSFLGEKMIAGIAIASCAPEVYNSELEGYAAQRGQLWQHSLLTAIASREIAGHSTRELRPEEAFTGGILHDIGKSVLSQYLAGETLTLMKAMESRAVQDFVEAERLALETDHSEAGMVLGLHWNLPEELLAVVRHHHDPGKAPEEHRALVYCVHLGDAMAQMHGVGTGADTLQYELAPETGDYFNIDEDTFQSIFMDVRLEFEKSRASFLG
ncbi:HDOD domain-containing protein [Oceanidesulfovibrio indonesiensis]|uniref:HDOD domain-containing protein n=1 Tax=Oceanidesulfovibrio indonesiensis TaxID=54767 RepID=A0A7M3MAA7_9BACT|nr:HDOD domain-containing protein [Oceanidesulfovibrio indonesiensis]TVM14546.1 HDOD domain-containing protein [Oceanidesulfovibrio indonesiensis]